MEEDLKNPVTGWAPKTLPAAARRTGTGGLNN